MITMSFKFVFDAEKCCGCGACVVACVDQNDTDIQGGYPSLRRVWAEETEEDGYGSLHFFSEACHHCRDAPCMAKCPKQCIVRDEETGLVVCDPRMCVGCGACLRACPYHIPYIDKQRKMHKCNGCTERIHAGLLPACVRICPTKALTLVEERMGP